MGRVLSRPAQQALSRDAVSLAGSLLPLCDILTLLLAGYLSTLLYTGTLGSVSLPIGSWAAFGPAVLVAAVLAPFILYDKQFGLLASRAQGALLVRGHGLRFVLLAGVVFAIGVANQSLTALPGAWLVLWGTTSLLFTSLTRVLLAAKLRHLERGGVLSEVIAIVGSGPLADRLVKQLRRGNQNIELLGVFDDKIQGAERGSVARTGSVAELIELGKTRKIDWIVMTLPCTAEDRLRAIVQRLKALAVPIGLCPENVGLTLPFHQIDYVGEGVPVTLLADRPIRRWGAVIKGGEDFVPRWIVTSLLLPLFLVEALLSRKENFARPVSKPFAPVELPDATSLSYQFDNYDLTTFTNVAASFGQKRFGYVVTPNADHLIRLHEDVAFRALYATAAYVLLDSRFLSHLLQFTQGIRLPVCTGSDLTAKLLTDVIEPEDGIVLIGGNAEQAQQLAGRFGLKNLAHYNPPMGFIQDAEAVETCLRFVETHSPFRFCLLAVGAPQQEMIAQRLKERGIARGLALCIGASINFLTGVEQRAPQWMQRSGLEWLYRLLQAPGRMANRYLVRGPRVFALVRRAQIVLRPVPALTLVCPSKSSKVAVQSSGQQAEPTLRAVPTPLRAEPQSQSASAPI